MEKLNLNLKSDLQNNNEIKVVQFGEGNFLRCFIDWMIHILNKQGLFNGAIAVVQPIPSGIIVPKLQAQDCLYTTVLNGIVEGKQTSITEIVNDIKCAINPYEQWKELLDLAKLESVKFVVSNTTEAGIAYVKENLTDKCPTSYPAKLTAFLYERFKAFNGCSGSGLFIMPCELIEANGATLKNIVLQYANDWNLGDNFINYVNNECKFFNTLVDRVVSGYPKNANEYFEKLGYEDDLLVCGEIFHFFAIEGDKALLDLLPFDKANLNVVVCDDISPYRKRKVRILNGAHTSNVPAAYLAGLETVEQMMTDNVTGPFANSIIFDEIIPSIDLDKDMLTHYAQDVVTRFKDKTLNHKLISILMNCTSKIKARVLPSILESRARGILPQKLCFALAAYICLYKNADTVPVKVIREQGDSGEFRDDQEAVDILHNAWAYYQNTEASAILTVKSVLSKNELWGSDLSVDIDLCTYTAKLLHAIVSDGIKATMQDLMEHK